MSKLEVNFAFEIGDLVYIKSASHRMDCVPKRYVVYERIAQQCHGGVQLLYKITSFDGTFPEVVLTKELPAYEPISEEALAEERELDARRAEWREVRWRARRENDEGTSSCA